MAVTDENYFDWPVLPEAPNSLNLSLAGNTAKLSWEEHGDNRTGIVVERSTGNNGAGAEKETWSRIARLSATATEYADSTLKKGARFAYRVRAINDDGESAYSNIARGSFSMTP